MCSRTCKICEVTYERIWLQDRPTRTVENPKNDFCSICGLLYYLDRDIRRLAYDFTEMPTSILDNLPPTNPDHVHPKLFANTASSPKTDDFETSSKYMKDRRHLEILEALKGVKPIVSEDDAVRAIQTNPILNPMGFSDTPAKTAILKSLRTLQGLGKINIEANYADRPSRAEGATRMPSLLERKMAGNDR